MRFTPAVVTGLGLMMATMMPGQATAEAKIYPYHGANYCPAGLQPVTISGVICCGKPNQHISYQQALAHPAKSAMCANIARSIPRARIVPLAKKGVRDNRRPVLSYFARP